MTDDDAIQIARRRGYGPIVKLEDDEWTKPHGIIIVDLAATPPTVTRVADEHPHLRDIK